MKSQLDVVARAFNPSTREAVGGGSPRAQGQPGLCKVLQANQRRDKGVSGGGVL